MASGANKVIQRPLKSKAIAVAPWGLMSTASHVGFRAASSRRQSGYGLFSVSIVFASDAIESIIAPD